MTFACLNLAIASSVKQYNVNQIFSFTRMRQAVASPDKTHVVFVTLEPKKSQNQKAWYWQFSIYLSDRHKKPTLIKTSSEPISTTRWSSDGSKFYYLAHGKKFQSIMIYNLETNQTKKLYESKTDIHSFKLSPKNNNRIVFVANDLSKIIDKPALSEVGKVSNDRLYLLTLKSNEAIVKPLTSSKISITQFSGNTLIDSGFDWSPGGGTIVYSYQPQHGATYNNQAKIAVLDLSTSKTTVLPFMMKHIAVQPHYSPDGKWIAFRSSSHDISNLANNLYAYGQICIANAKTLKTKCLSNTFNEAPTIIGWGQNSEAIFVLDNYKTDGPQIYRLTINNKFPPTLISDKQGYIDVGTISLNSKHDTFAFSWQSLSQQPNIFISQAKQYSLIPIPFKDTMRKHLLGRVKVINWASKDGLKIEGLLIFPLNYNANKRYPLIVLPHGGPINVWEKRYLGGCEEYGRAVVPNCAANLLSLGFVVFEPNYRGSDGYGKSFRFANIGDLGGGDYRDVMSGIDYLINKKIADPKRLAIFGWSYGGYLAAWSITQTDRFKAAIDGDGLTNFVSFAGTSDLPWYLSQYLGGTFWQKHRLYLNRSPITFVNKIKTPLLILHGENDKRVPVSQSYELYNNLIFQNKNVKMLVASGEAHVPVNPNVIAQEIQEVDRWLKGNVLIH